MIVLFAVVASTLLISGFCSLFEATLYSTRIATLEAATKEDKHRKAARRMLEMKNDVSIPTSAILILNTVANTAGAALAGMYSAQVFGASWVPAFSVALTFSILFFSEILPKTYGAVHWRSVWSMMVWPLAFIEKGLYPLIRITQAFSQFFTRGHRSPVITEDEILAMIHVGAKAGQLTPAELRMLDSVFHFHKLSVRQVVVPRNEVVFLEVNQPAEELIKIAKQTEHTRYPLCRGSMDEVLGIIHVKDLLDVRPEDGFDLTSIMRPARHVPETKRISGLLAEMQRSRQHMAIVVDEHGSTAGIITLENVLEQIVGAVQDEFDRETPDTVKEGAGRFIVRGATPLESINRELNLQFAASGVNTLSGFLVAQVGRFLKTGDKIKLKGATAEVLEIEGNRAVRVRLTLVRTNDSET